MSTPFGERPGLAKRASLLTAESARALLCKLRDLNLTGVRIALTAHASVSIAGCLSLDTPGERCLSYRLHLAGGREGMLRVVYEGEELRLSLADLQGRARGRELRVPLATDEKQRITARSIGARIRPDGAGEREVEHFLRRLVRGVFRNAG